MRRVRINFSFSLARLFPAFVVLTAFVVWFQLHGAGAATNIVVTTTTDELTLATNGVCSLREAVRLANGDTTDSACGADSGGPYVIQLASGATYLLNLTGANEDGAATGDLDIKNARVVTVEPNGAMAATIDGNATDRVFEVLAGGDLTLDSVVVTNGSAANGGAIFNSGALQITDSTIAANATTGGGGAIYNSGSAASVEIDGSTLRANTAAIGGAIYNASGAVTISDSTIGGPAAADANTARSSGGGVYNELSGDLVFTGVTIQNNISGTNGSGLGGGIISLNTGSTVDIDQSTVSDNTALTAGGVGAGGGTLEITNSTISGNDATFDTGGGVFVGFANTATIDNTTIRGNTAVTRGGGIYVTSGTLNLTNSRIDGANHAGDGGGIFNVGNGNVTVTGTLITGNGADHEGGGVNNNDGTMTLSSVWIAGNSSDQGGGVSNDDSLSIFRSTISGNTTSDDGGGVHNSTGVLVAANSTISGNTGVFGGGVYQEQTATFVNVTITDNRTIDVDGDSGAGIFTPIGGSTMFVNSIIANQAFGVDCAGVALTSQGNNLESGTDCGFTQSGDQQNATADLAALTNNGGSTPTHALGANSDALDAGNLTVCQTAQGSTGSAPFDQRGPGFDRVSGATCDIGAFEAQGVANTATNTPTVTNTATPTATDTLTPTATNTTAPATTTSVATATNTPTRTNTPTATLTNTPTATATSTASPTATNTPTQPTATADPTTTSVATSTRTPTRTPTATTTPPTQATATKTPRPGATATKTAVPTKTKAPTRTPTPTKTPHATATQRPPNGCADVDGDGKVTIKDVQAIQLAIAQRPSDRRYDVDGNGRVDVKDLKMALDQLGQRCQR